MANIIDIDDVRAKGIDLSVNIDTDRFDGFCQIVQESELYTILGNDLYNNVIANIDTTYSDLKPYIVNYLCFATYDYYLSNGNMFGTHIGMRRKEDNNQSELSDTNLINANKRILKIHTDRLYDFLKDKEYDLWDKNTKTLKSNKISIRSI